MISNKMRDLVNSSSLIRAMFEEGKRLKSIYGPDKVFDFSLGNPNVEPPKEIVTAIHEILDEESPSMVHGYMNNSGYEDVREKIAAYTSEQYNTQVGKEHIVMTCGAAGGLNVLFKTLLNPDDEVIVFAPFFSEYRNYANNHHAKLVIVPSDKTSFQPDLKAFEQHITDKTKAVLINSPNNPTGVIYSHETLEQLSNIIKAKEQEYGHGIFLISDEPYREIVYDNIEVPYLLHYHTNAVIVYSYSKSLSLPGERIGYLVVHPKIEDVDDVMAGLNVANRILGFVNAPSLFQRVIAKTLGVKVDLSVYEKNRNVLYEHLTQLGFGVLKPEGAFYLFMKTPIADDKQFCKDAKAFNLLLVPGSAFGCPGYVRLAYCIAHDTVMNSLPAFEKLWQSYDMK
ncbi:pyridoxal phosphate-dependent aminotransferase [Vallitalea pronyensis]|uniref:Aminotransferase n=2 Tax=Vallitalea pronyensis TaxID=1348613 RepID=A0A8J8SJH9_9FIRM|nr:pyridoxal phosphate-dependent aminotransferase [Vallitalea pronyensis]QUI25588.1 pyridoxal phosphate-dependent aminotransferase [Vallitalea pronyensis]